ncbi:putative NAD binding NADP oxidoreductase coenzyme F420-dependent [Aspergillus keveii]|uniref:NAD binding NADP oxidoreductase coenzyme F420-dependent n=1 Tax=Aspergillus keveii TaxID=714993 RepID=A0ABR4GNB3_9EURO
MAVGFLGLGTMGLPMALNLSRHHPLTVWNRSVSKYALLNDTQNITIAETPLQAVEASEIIFIMLFDAVAIDAVLTDDVKRALKGKTIINSTSVTVEYSQNLGKTIQDVVGGYFVEMPVSGSKIPAEQGQLVGLMAGEADVAERVRPYLGPLTSAAIYCGPLGSGLKAKYAANTFATILAAGVGETMHFAQALGLDLDAFGQVLDASPMASAYSRGKVAKIQKGDWEAQASVGVCCYSARLIEAAAEEAGASLPLMKTCKGLYEEATADGLGKEDMVAVMKTIAKRSRE